MPSPLRDLELRMRLGGLDEPSRGGATDTGADPAAGTGSQGPLPAALPAPAPGRRPAVLRRVVAGAPEPLPAGGRDRSRAGALQRLGGVISSLHSELCSCCLYCATTPALGGVEGWRGRAPFRGRQASGAAACQEPLSVEDGQDELTPQEATGDWSSPRRRGLRSAPCAGGCPLASVAAVAPGGIIAVIPGV